MKMKAKTSIKGLKDKGEYTFPGEEFEADEVTASRLIALDAAEEIKADPDPEKAAAEKAAAEKAPAEKAPAEKAPAEKAPAEKAPAEKAPAEKAPAEKNEG
jgi:hypothetical protein